MADVEQAQCPEQPRALQPDTGPVLLSFPAILRNSTLSDRFAHLRVPSQDSPPRSRQRTARKDRPEPEGKRWVRRRENARFAHNPHAILPTSVDFAQPLQVPLSTFPHPLPVYLPRTVPVPPSRPPPSLPSTSSAGLFSLSLRGVRRTLRARPSSASLAKVVETHLATWLEGGTYLNPDQAKGLLCFPGDPVCGREDVREVGREAGRLVWAVSPDHSALGNPGYRDGAFERYVVHCVARWYGVVSFSKETDGHRLTYLLRPNVARPDPRLNTVSRTLDTPPVTDASDSHVSDANLSDFEVTDASGDNATDASDVGSVTGDLSPGARALSDIEESHPSSLTSWPVLGGSDFGFAVDADSDTDDRGFAASMESLSLSARPESDNLAAPSAGMTLEPSRSRLQCTIVATRAGFSGDAELDQQDENTTSALPRGDQDRVRALYPRSASSPSPARRPSHRLHIGRKSGARRKRKAKNEKGGFTGAIASDKGSFYDFVFA